MEFEKIKGYKELPEAHKTFFQQMFKRHQACLGSEAKIAFTPVSVKLEKGYLKVSFKNSEWLHYSQNGTWY